MSVVKSQLRKRFDTWIYCQCKQTDCTEKHFMDCYSILTCQISTGVSLYLPRYHRIFSAHSPRPRSKYTGQWIIYARETITQRRTGGPQCSLLSWDSLPFSVCTENSYYSLVQIKIQWKKKERGKFKVCKRPNLTLILRTDLKGFSQQFNLYFSSYLI